MALAGAVIRWRPLVFLVIPLGLFWLLRRLRYRQSLKWWLPALAAYFVLLPFSFGPVFMGDMWVSQNVTKKARLYSLDAYKPVMIATKFTPLYDPVWRWFDWLNGPVHWDGVRDNW